MTKRKSDSGGKKAKWVGFYNWRPSDEEKAAVRANLVKPDKAFRVLSEFAERGYKVSVSWDGWGDCPMVSITGQTAENPNAGFTLTCRHHDVLVALSLGYWFCAVSCGWERWPENEGAQMSFDW